MVDEFVVPDSGGSALVMPNNSAPYIASLVIVQ